MDKHHFSLDFIHCQTAEGTKSGSILVFIPILVFLPNIISWFHHDPHNMSSAQHSQAPEAHWVTFQSHFLWQGFKVCTKETNTKLFDQMHSQSVTQTDCIEPTIHFAIKDVLLWAEHFSFLLPYRSLNCTKHKAAHSAVKISHATYYPTAFRSFFYGHSSPLVSSFLRFYVNQH